MKAKSVDRKIWVRGGALGVVGLLATAVTFTAATFTAVAESQADHEQTAPPLPFAETLRYLATTHYRADPDYPTASQFRPSHALAPVLASGPAFLEAPGYERAVAVAAWAPTDGPLDEELRCLALNIYFEARSESAAGKAAVAHVAMNRAQSHRFPDTVCAVIRQGGETRRHRCQFSWWCDGRSDKPINRRSWKQAQAIAHDVYWNVVSDPTAGALWYHADYVKPYWSRVFAKGPKIGQHIFYHDRKSRVQVAAQF